MSFVNSTPHIFLNEGFMKWSTVTSGVLPYGLVWPKITNFDERILLFGKSNKCFFFWFAFHTLEGASDRSFNEPETFYDSILEFNPDTKVWAQIGVMTRPRAHHGVTIVNFEEFKSVCTL